MSLIEIEKLEKHFKVLNRREGLIGAMKDLFSGDYRMVRAVDGVSLSIEEGEIVGLDQGICRICRHWLLIAAMPCYC